MVASLEKPVADGTLISGISDDLQVSRDRDLARSQLGWNDDTIYSRKTSVIPTLSLVPFLCWSES